MSENRIPDTPAIPGVDVKIYLLKDPEKDHGKLLGFASVNLGGVFAVNNIRIYNSDKGPFISMPSTKGKDGQYHDICCPTTKEMREALHGAVLCAYQKEVTQECPSIRASIKENVAEAASCPFPEKQAKRTADKRAR